MRRRWRRRGQRILAIFVVVGAVWWTISQRKPGVTFLRYEAEGEFVIAVYLAENATNEVFYYWGPSAFRPAEPHTREKAKWGWNVSRRRDHPGDLFDEYRVEPGERVEMRIVLPVDRQKLPPFQLGIRFYRRTIIHDLPWNWQEWVPEPLLKPAEVVVWTDTVNP